MRSEMYRQYSMARFELSLSGIPHSFFSLSLSFCHASLTWQQHNPLHDNIIRDPGTCAHPTSIVLDLLNSNNSVLLVSGPLTMSYSRGKLADIPALTLYSDGPTLSRRGQPIPQLIRKSKPCKSFTPDVVRCVNLGGEGANVDWKVCP